VTDPIVPDCFPPDDRVALFVVSMAMAGNDVEYALRQVVLANPEGASDEDRARNRFSQKVRLTYGFLFEGIDALKAWAKDEPDVVKLLRALPPDGAALLKQVRGLEQQIGPDAIAHVRHHTFHYPHPDPAKNPDSTAELAEVIATADDVIARVDARSDGEHTFPFADQIAVGLSLSRHDDIEVQGAKVPTGAVAFVHLVRHIHLRYCNERGITSEVIR